MDGTKYIGMDVHKESVSIAVMNSAGKVVMESVIGMKASMILQFVDGLRGDLLVTFEEGTWAALLYDLPRPHVTRIVVCNPRRNALLKWRSSPTGEIETRFAMFRNGSPATRALSIASRSGLEQAKHVRGIGRSSFARPPLQAVRHNGSAGACSRSDSDFLRFSPDHPRQRATDSNWRLEPQGIVNTMGKLLCFERAFYRADGYTRHDCVCCRVEVGCVFNFEPFLLPVGYTLGCQSQNSLLAEDVDCIPVLHSPAERAKLALI